MKTFEIDDNVEIASDSFINQSIKTFLTSLGLSSKYNNDNTINFQDIEALLYFFTKVQIESLTKLNYPKTFMRDDVQNYMVYKSCLKQTPDGSGCNNKHNEKIKQLSDFLTKRKSNISKALDALGIKYDASVNTFLANYRNEVNVGMYIDYLAEKYPITKKKFEEILSFLTTSEILALHGYNPSTSYTILEPLLNVVSSYLKSDKYDVIQKFRNQSSNTSTGRTLISISSIHPRLNIISGGSRNKKIKTHKRKINKRRKTNKKKQNK